jgi:hypothetical protein
MDFMVGQKYKGFYEFRKGKTFPIHFQFCFKNNFLAKIGLMGVIPEVHRVV